MSLVNDMLRDLEKKPVPRGTPEQLVTDQNKGRSALGSFLPALVAFLIVGVAVWFSVDPETGESIDSSPAPETRLADAPESSVSDVDAGAVQEQAAAPINNPIDLLNQPKTNYYDDAVSELIKRPDASVSSSNTQSVSTSKPQNQTVDKSSRSTRAPTLVASTARSVKVNQIFPD